MRKGDWKRVNYNVFNPDRTTVKLYNIPADAGEQSNIEEEPPEIVEELNRLMESARSGSEIFTFE